MNLFYQPRLSEGITFLDGDEAHHALKVMRLRTGAEILVTDGKGVLASAVLTDGTGFKITKQERQSPRAFAIHLFVAPTKNADRMEWLVEKVTEIGVASITMISCQRNERKSINHDRLEKMAISAMKQSQQTWLPEINPITAFEKAIAFKADQKFIAFVDQSNPDLLKKVALPSKSYSLFIGPEGDFTTEEVGAALASGFKKTSLGPTRLRTETAALAAVLTLQILNLEP